MTDLRAARVRAVVLAGVLVAVYACGGPSLRAQQAGAPAGSSSSASEAEKPTASDAVSTPRGMDEKKPDVDGPKAAAPMSDKQKKLAADTDKLLALAKELKQQVDKTNKNVLSVSVVKKAEEIEKLARSVKTEMK